MANSDRPPGKTTVSPDVLINIAKLSALGVPGVSHMAAVPGGVNRLFRRGDQGAGRQGARSRIHGAS